MKAWKLLGQKLCEAAAALSHSDVRAHLQSGLQAKHPGNYPYLHDVFGDGDTGSCVYGMGSNYYQAPYEISQSGNSRVASIGAHQQVMPRTVYDPMPDEAEWIAAIEGLTAEEKALAVYPQVARMLFFERFISKSQRDKLSSGDFAGKGKSFPIDTPEDVPAALRSIGRAGADNYSPSTIHANILKIAKRKGFANQLPADSKESADSAREVDVAGEYVSLREGAVEKDGRVLAKLIAPGWGSSGYYGKEMLKRDLPKAFRKGTKMYWNHQTAAEEAARPEGNLDDVASILAEDAHYDENGPLGPGGYAYADTVEHYRPAIENLSKHMGVSIRARGTAQEGEAEGRKGPIINSLTHGISVDYVTEAGAGGKVVSLFEAARPQKIRESRKEENDMDKTEVQALIEAAVTPLNATLTKANGENLKLRQRLAVTEAAGEADKVLATLSLHEGVRARVKSRVLGGVIPLTEAGELDGTKLKELLEAEAKDESAYIAKLTEGKQVVNMGAPTEKPADLTEAEYEKQMVASFMESGMSEAAAKVAAKGAVN